MPASQPTTAQRRTHYDDFVAQVIQLCKVNSIRSDLVSGRGRPREDCPRMDEHLIHRIAGHPAVRAHYTVASLIAMQRRLPDADGPYRPETAAGHDSATEQLTAAPAQMPPTPSSAPAAGTAALQQQAARAWRRRPNLGTSLAIAATRHGFTPASMTSKVKVLTKLGTDLLHPRLWSLATHLHSKNAARLDFAVLLEDLTWWDHDRPHTAARWRESYFTTLHRLTHPKEH